MKLLITGGCGFLGSNLAQAALEKGLQLTVLDSLYRHGSSENLKWLQTKGTFKFYHADIRNYNDVEKAILETKPDVIFHLAGQVAMTTSIDDPRRDFETNVIGGHNVLEVVRKNLPNTIITYSSTNKVYGDLDLAELKEGERRYTAPNYPNGFKEDLPLNFQSPYGCSKGAMDQYMLDYARIFNLKTVVFRHSSIFGGRQFSTFDQGWIGWFVQQALLTQKGKLKEPFTISGNGKQVRDVLFAPDLVNCYFSAIADTNIEKTRGQAFNIGGGISNSLSLLELFDFLEKELNVKLNYKQLPWRTSDQRVFVADNTKAKQLFGWEPCVNKESAIRQMIEWTRAII